MHVYISTHGPTQKQLLYDAQHSLDDSSGGYRHCEGRGLEIIIAREAHESFSPRLLFPLGHAHKTLAIARLSITETLVFDIFGKFL